ncbi:MAG: hypothetical protein AB7T63_07195 [Planctomycetota bacterium]
MRHAAWLLTLALLTGVGCGGGGDGALAPAPADEHAKAPSAPAPSPVRGRGSRGGSKKDDYVVDASVLEHAGRIEGVLRLESKPELRRIVIDKDVEACGHESHPSERCVFDPETLGLASCVITLQGIAKGKDWPEAMKPKDRKGTLVMRQCMFVPHVQVLREKTWIVVDNQDNALHNLHAYHERMSRTGSSFGMGSAGTRHVIAEAYLAKPGKYLLKCDIHPWMNGTIHAVTNPYFAVTDTSGTFALEGVPPGSYKLKIWHEGMGEVPILVDNKISSYEYSEDWVEEIPVTLGSGQTVRVERTIPPR